MLFQTLLIKKFTYISVPPQLILIFHLTSYIPKNIIGLVEAKEPCGILQNNIRDRRLYIVYIKAGLRFKTILLFYGLIFCS